ncbi:MAG: hypothetical protein R2690_14355 [Acidimicrobiales bacterium]
MGLMDNLKQGASSLADSVNKGVANMQQPSAGGAPPPAAAGPSPDALLRDLGALTWQDANGVLDDDGAAERQRVMQELANLAAPAGSICRCAPAQPRAPPPPAPAPGTPPPPPEARPPRRRRAMPPRHRPRHPQARRQLRRRHPRPRAVRWAARWRPRPTVARCAHPAPGALRESMGLVGPTPPPEDERVHPVGDGPCGASPGTSTSTTPPARSAATCASASTRTSG